VTASKTKTLGRSATADTTDAVNQFMAELNHSFKAEIEELRTIILSVDGSISEGIKWNAPSFRTSEYFATTNLRTKRGVGLILHLGAKVRELPGDGLKIADPTNLLKWLAKDRATVEFGSLKELRDSSGALKAVLRQWIRHV
jgi:hypothetical protein